MAAAGLYCGYGMSVPVAPTGAAIIAVILVRAVLWSKNQSIMWNAAICGLCIMATFTTIEGTETSTFFGFWIGVGYGAMGVGIIEFGKRLMSGALKERFAKASDVLFGVTPKDPPQPPVQ